MHDACMIYFYTPFTQSYLNIVKIEKNTKHSSSTFNILNFIYYQWYKSVLYVIICEPFFLEWLTTSVQLLTEVVPSPYEPDN